MSSLLAAFAVSLKKQGPPNAPERNGPLFHRWLPNGEEDSLSLHTGDPNAELRVWFHRWGYVDNTGRIEFDGKRRELNEEIISKTGRLDAGALFGELKMTRIAQETLTLLANDKTEEEQYIRLVKKIIDLVYEHAGNFLRILRIQYGQYWIRELPQWDSRNEPLINYCRWIMNLRWSVDEGKTWKQFFPNQNPVLMMTIDLDDRPYAELLTKEDWLQIGNLVQRGYEPQLAAVTLARAHELLAQNDVKHALIESVSAVELAVNELFHRKYKSSASHAALASSFANIPLKAQLTAVSTVIPTLAVEDIERALRIIDMRNDVVHEGREPPSGAQTELSIFLRIIARLLPEHKFKFPINVGGNTYYP